ncbi:MAG TPA: radical SAM family heme chaperone HemW [Bellilinea sp.]|nr:radical SAM family heme chaperone HemW [Bellilinea sp.]
MSDLTSLYIHIPFCRHRCSYCDFNTYAGLERLIPDYMEALRAEAIWAGQTAGGHLPVHTIFLGGGTPSLIPADELARLLETCNRNFDVLPDAEITLEANPGTVTLESLRALRGAGFNRISLGMQSANTIDLALLERQHDTLEVFRAVEWARQAGFANLNLDLIYGLPSQPLQRWQETLETALSLRPDHFSLYALSIEHGTPFRKWLEHGLVSAPDDDLAADMFDWACERLETAGYRHYEISNWGRRNDAQVLSCRHNLQYWRNLPYFGLGAGAHGYVNGVRTANLRGVKTYIQSMSKNQPTEFPASSAVETAIPVDQWTAMQEHMMMGLRLLEEGVSNALFHQRFGVSLQHAFPQQIQRLEQIGLLEWAGDGGDALRLSRRGWLLGNQAFSEFVDVEEPAGLL